jgi:aminoglycoside phosphotransferase (APT) family kinase protein
MPRQGLRAAALERVRELVAPGGRVSRVRPLRGGISSSVHLVQLTTDAGVRQAVVVRRYGEYWQRTDPAACEREFRLLGVLAQSGFPAPRPLLLDAEGGPFGAPTVIMSRLPGRPSLSPRDRDGYLRQMADTLARLHALPTEHMEFLPDQRRIVERTVAAEYEGDDPLQREINQALRAPWPRVAHEPRVLVHGDYWPGNLLWLRGRLVGVVDWEQPRLGAPGKDIATCRGDLWVLFGPEAADAFVSYYEEAAQRTVSDMSFWDVLISTWAVREMDAWVEAYQILGRPDLTPEVARGRIRAFARAALEAQERA